MAAESQNSTKPRLRFAEAISSVLLDRADDPDWADRSETWAERCQVKSRHKTAQRQPLILTGHNVSLRIEHGALLIRNGFTHYPQKQEVIRYFKGDADRPSRILLLDVNGSISFDVLAWLQEQDIPLIQLDWKGGVVCVASRSGYAANGHRVAWQQETRTDEKKRLAFASQLIETKVRNSLEVMLQKLPATDVREIAIIKANESLARLAEGRLASMNDVRGIEANAAAAYFRAWKDVRINWRDTHRRPVPAGWLQFERRQSALGKTGNSNASHPINAMLNYAYTLLQAHIQIAAIAEGYDPALGLMHEPRPGPPAFIFDMMEPHRPKVDAVVLGLIEKHRFHAADFTVRSDGVCRLNPQLAKHIATVLQVDFKRTFVA
jgi:CRISPR-associated endonuclease Cas1